MRREGEGIDSDDDELGSEINMGIKHEFSTTTKNVVGLIETVLACSAMIYLCVWRQQWAYLLVASTVAPLLLLRTKLSTLISRNTILTYILKHLPSIKSEDEFIKIAYMPSKRDHFNPPLFWLNIQASIVALFSRITAIGLCFWFRPSKSLAAIPGN